MIHGFTAMETPDRNPTTGLSVTFGDKQTLVRLPRLLRCFFEMTFLNKLADEICPIKSGEPRHCPTWNSRTWS